MIIRTLLGPLRILTVAAVVATLLLHNYARITCRWKWQKPDLRMVVIADPQMEGDAKIARLGKRAIVDLAFNDAYMRHIYKAMTNPSWTQPQDFLKNWIPGLRPSQSAYPTHVAILGDLFSSQWIDDTEFETRVSRYKSIFPMADQNDYPALINITGNHDIGYGYDISQARLDRWEGAFGLSNFVQVVDIAGSKQKLHLVVLNTMLLDGPSADENLRGQTWEFLQEVANIKERDPDDKIILLTHIPFHKEAGTCVDPPSIDVHWDSTIIEQTMLTPNSTFWILNHLQPDFVLNGHDHFGCDVTHTPSSDQGDGQYIWTAQRTSEVLAKSPESKEQHREPVREVTQRSMMAEFGGYSGLFEIKVNKGRDGIEASSTATEFHYTSCGFSKDLQVWIVIVVDLIVAGCWSVYAVASVVLGLGATKPKIIPSGKKEKQL
ncbi:hypothetical protein BGZ83_009974 [Gryganskiella cystojenkinii]|nr:hypothetical protein BGZ83_009974 [Gryganskiella cystojenkinii]